MSDSISNKNDSSLAMKAIELSEIPVSFYRNMKYSVSESLTVGRVLNGIRGSFYQSQIEKIRLLAKVGKKAESDEIKQNLHAVTFCATYDGRRLSSLYKQYNSLMVIDIDKLETDEMDRVKNCLEQNPYVGCYWISPSGKGWKGLVPLLYLNEYNKTDVVDNHHWAFAKIEELFKTRYDIKLDASGKDITRLCFMSWCPDLRIKDEFDRFVVDMSEMVEEKKRVKDNPDSNKIVFQSSGEPIQWNLIDGRKQEGRTGNAYDRRLVERIYKYLESKHESITSTYEDWVKVAFAIAHTFHSTYGRKIFMKFCELDGTAHNKKRSERLIYDAYITPDKLCDFSTIIYLSKRKGFVR